MIAWKSSLFWVMYLCNNNKHILLITSKGPYNTYYVITLWGGWEVKAYLMTMITPSGLVGGKHQNLYI